MVGVTGDGVFTGGFTGYTGVFTGDEGITVTGGGVEVLLFVTLLTVDDDS